MNVLVSTVETQGQRENDFCFVPEGELVKFGFSCDRDVHADGDCGCMRSLVGVETSKATTTFKVASYDKTQKEWLDAVEESYYRDGWDTAIDNAEILEIAATYPIGTVLEKRGDIIQLRQ